MVFMLTISTLAPHMQKRQPYKTVCTGLCIDFLRESIQTHAAGEINLVHEAQRHLHQRPSHPIKPILQLFHTAGELVSHHVAILVLVLLGSVFAFGVWRDKQVREELLILLPVPHVVGRHAMESFDKHLGVGRGCIMPQPRKFLG